MLKILTMSLEEGIYVGNYDGVWYLCRKNQQYLSGKVFMFEISTMSLEEGINI